MLFNNFLFLFLKIGKVIIMFQNNPILSELKKKFRSKIFEIEGTIKNTNKGFGFLETEVRKNYFIPSIQMKKVMHGDKVIAQIRLENYKEIANPIKLLKPFLNKFVGKIQKKNNNLFISPDYSFINNISIHFFDKKLISNVQVGDWVLAKLVKHKLNGYNFFYATIIKIIAKKEDMQAPWNVTLARHNLKKEEPNIKDLKFNFLTDTEERIDLTHLDFISIDNNSTKDIDDVLFIQRNKKNDFILTVAIADPTAYISDNSKLDSIALNRSFTIYLPRFNVPMLPRKLSEDICSLKPNLSRPALVCKVTISKDGSLKEDSISFSLAWIKSKDKLVYEDVSNWLEKKGTWKPKNKRIANQLLLLRSFYKIRYQWRKENTSVFKDRLEYRFQFDEFGTVINVAIEYRNIAHKIIEESMIVANICAAKVLSKELGYGIYNVHSGFNSVNAEKAVTILAKYGVYFKANEIATLKGFCKLNKILNNLKNSYITNRIRKFQSYSEFSITPGLHFGLGFKYYATWTSPIRKYSDMVNHRLLKSIILNKKTFKPNINIISKISNCKLKNRIVERDVLDWLYIIFLKNKIKEQIKFKSEIIQVFKSGIRVRLIDNGAVAYIPACFLHRIKSELSFNKDEGIVYISKKPAYFVSDTLLVIIIEIKEDQKMIIARLC